jgi:hypothetical protein
MFMKKRILVFASLLAFGLSSCQKDESIGKAILKVRLTDAPADYEAVNVDVQGIEVNRGQDEKEGWVRLENIYAGVYDLLKLTNGLDTLLASEELPVGKISQIRLILGKNNSLQMKGEKIVLQTPSGEQSGLKVNVHTTLQEGIVYTLLLDFDAARSIVKSGNSGNYILKPVIRSIVEAQSGAIKGMVSPANAAGVIYAIAGTDTVSTYADATTGGFLLKGLQAGTYKVVLAEQEVYQEKTIENVTVTIGTISSIGTLEVSSK